MIGKMLSWAFFIFALAITGLGLGELLIKPLTEIITRILT
jgi:hypothetical protein